MLAIGRGMTHFIEVPDAPPTGVFVTVRGAAASSASQSADVSGGSAQFSSASLTSHATVALSLSSHDSTPTLSSAPVLPQSVSSVVTELQGSTSSSLRGADSQSSGGGEIGRDGESLAPMSLAWADSSDNGWFIVPSAANEYGESYAAASDEFTWDVAGGEFAVDFFFV